MSETRDDQVTGTDLNEADIDAGMEPAEEMPLMATDEATGVADQFDADVEAATQPAPKKTKAPEVVNYKLAQTDDDPVDPEHPPLSVPAIKEIIKTGGDWAESFDPLSGFAPTAKETEIMTAPSKIITVEPHIKGSAKNPQPVIINGVQQYKPTNSVRNFPVNYDADYVEDVLSGIFGDSVSKYVLDNLLKPFNRMVENEYYGRKMPVRAFNAPFKVSLAAIEAATGVSYGDHLTSLLRSGWYKKSASVRKFEMAVMCDTPEKLEAILDQKGRIIQKWKPADFPLLIGTVQVFKRVGKIVADGFTYKGKAPTAASLYAILDAISAYSEPLSDRLLRIEEAEQDVANGTLPAESITEKVISIKEQIIEQLGHWGTVTCGLKGLAEQLQKAETEKLAKVQSTAPLSDALDSIDGLDGLDLALLAL